MRRQFFRSTAVCWVLLPLAFVPLLIQSRWPRTWSSVQVGWPWHYGKQFTDPNATQIPQIENLLAFFGDFFIGLAVVLVLWLLSRLSLWRKHHGN